MSTISILIRSPARLTVQIPLDEELGQAMGLRVSYGAKIAAASRLRRLRHRTQPSDHVRIRWRLAQRVDRPHPFRHRHAALQVFAADTVKPLGCDLRIPYSVRIDDKPRTVLTQPQAGRLGAHRGNGMLRQRHLELFPSRESLLARATVRPDTEEEMVAGRGQAD